MQLADVLARIAGFSQEILLPKARGWAAKFAIGAGTPIVMGKAEAFIRATGTVSETGDVDVDKLHEIVMKGFNAAGHLDLMGGTIGFDPSDAEELFAYVKR